MHHPLREENRKMAAMEFVRAQRSGAAGLITLARPKALNALSLDMIRDLTGLLLGWRDDPAVQLVAIRGSSRDPADAAAMRPFGAFCAGGDIRFFHQAALAGDPALEDFFTEEYRLNHLIHHYAKPIVALMDGIVMGGGMGIAQGARHRVVTERTKMAMPETGIGLFPDVGGGYFLSRCAGHTGEYLALTGRMLDGAQAVAVGLADHRVASETLSGLWERLASGAIADGEALATALRIDAQSAPPMASPWPPGLIDRYFGLASVGAIVQALDADATRDDWARDTVALLRQRSPLMLHVTLAQIRRARTMTLADELRMERDLVRHCFFPMHLGRSGASTEVVEGVRALAVDKDHHPRWKPAQIADVEAPMVEPFFESPWPAHAHPLRDLD
jgi:enoyl-CoA hydratase/carnithine racemase